MNGANVVVTEAVGIAFMVQIAREGFGIVIKKPKAAVLRSHPQIIFFVFINDVDDSGVWMGALKEFGKIVG